MRRRGLPLGILTAATAGLWRLRGIAAAGPALRAWRDPYCGCCGAWIEHMRAAGFVVEDSVVSSLAPIRRTLGTPPDLLSCHAAMIEGFALEGHVPGTAVRRLLSERPAGVRGLAVLGMPTGSPGMEVRDKPDEAYDVIAFGSGSHRPFMRFVGGRPI